MKKLCIAFLLFCFVLPAYSNTLQKTSIEKYDLSIEQAYDLMIVNNNAIKAAFEATEEKRHKKNAAIGHFFPKIGVNTTVAGLSDDISIPLAPTKSIMLQDNKLWEVGAGAVWNVFTGGKILAMNSAARAYYEGSNEKLREIKGDLTCELIKRYYGLKLAKDVIDVRKQVEETTKKHLSDAIKLEKNGIIPKTERLHAEVAYEKAQRELLAAQRDANIIENSLKNLIKDDSVDLENVTVSPTSALFMYQKDFLNVNEYTKNALEKNPQLKQVEAKKKLAQANYRSQVSNYSPIVSLFAYDIFGSKDLSAGVPRWAMGASVNFVAFDGLTRLNEVKAADSFRKEVKYEQKDAQYNIETLVNKQYQELLKYKEQYDSTSKSMESAQESLRVTTKSFQEGYSTSLNVTDAQTALSGVKIERLNALYNYDVTLAQLLKTNGEYDKIFEHIKESKTEQL
ncbi:MAG: TolC family protein [Candidatus Gastranaerophilales bacterium]|nr:TolC family protein [Candidatus Gastranaerophilales bacterium]